MEIKLENVSYTYKEKKILKQISFTAHSGSIYGIYGRHKSLLLEILDLTKNYSGTICYDGVEVTKENIRGFQKMVGYVTQKDLFIMPKVEEELLFVMEKYEYTSKDDKKRMLDALKLVGLPESILKRKITTLSKSEKILVKFAGVLLVNPKIILVDDVFCYLSYPYKKKILQMLKRLNTKKEKLIMISTNDVDFLYQYTDQVLIIDNGKVVVNGETDKVFLDFKTLEKYHIDVAELVNFVMLAKEKGVRLAYHKDILDLIKDVYKHV